MELHPTKNVVVANADGARRALRGALARIVQPPTISYTTRDLGVDSNRTREAVSTARVRRKAAAARAQRVAALPYVPAFRKEAAMALIVSGAMYGTSVQGMARTALLRLRTAVQKCINGGTPGRRCVEVDLNLRDSDKSCDPAVVVPCRVVSE